ncbi:MAG: adenylate/guanylate cyclase domain-containing protein [Hahellaceae bacterium]|jgi:hypothetical protein|nr:adenylate/guanylate cyclase domain-containing protein [Hahellaceae bacterium]MCP5210832.1 adenylate/guanylate cyclase domain-containing protein [Hahellaceae bacterium]
MMSSQNYAVLFADVAGSSDLYKKIGDERAKEAISSSMRIMESLININAGIVIKTIGDEIMARFDDPNAATAAARAIQQHFEAARGSVAVRVGYHYGPAILENNDVFGDAVNTAARMVAVANPWQIVTSEITVDCLSPENQLYAKRFDYAKIKAFKESVPICLINWEENTGSMTALMPVIKPVNRETSISKITIHVQGTIIAVTPAMTDYTIGRDAECDLVVPSPFASRKHAWIEFRRNKFVLVDHSTNGTWVKTGGEPELFLKREELPLQGKGVISLGEPIANNQNFIIRFDC